MKRSFLKSAVALVTCVLVVFGAGHAYADEQKLPSGTPYDQIGQKIEDYYKEHEKTSAGMATTVIDKDGQTIYQKNFGYMDKEKKLAVDDNSVFEWGSTTKITVWVSVMQLWEEGKINLETDIKEYLPKGFLKTLKYDKPITMRDLMNHQAGFDEWMFYMGTDRSLEQALSQGQPAQSYEPGTTTAYSNFSTALAGYIVERVSGQKFADYVHEHIFQPLSMKHTALLPDLSDNSYVKEKREQEKVYDANGKLIGAGEFPISVYPAGRATGTFADIKKFAQALLSKKSLFERTETWDKFYSATNTYPGTDIPINTHGLWATEFENTRTLGHGGNTAGFTTSLLLDFKSGIASVVMANQLYEQNYTAGIPTLIYGKAHKPSQEAVKAFESGYYRISRTMLQGPFSFMRIQNTTYLTDAQKHPELSTMYWAYDKSEGQEKIKIPISDLTKVSTFDVIKDYGALLLAALAVVYAFSSYLLGALVKAYRLLFRKKAKVATPKVWIFWHYTSAALVLAAATNMFVLFTASKDASTSSTDVIWQFILFAILAVVLLLASLVPFVWNHRFPLSKGKKVLTFLTSSASLLIVFNIIYRSLDRWWVIK